MGGVVFTQVGQGESAKSVYNYLRNQAIQEDGHDPYNGTISTTHGFSMETLPQKRVTKQAVLRWIKENTDEIMKGDCMCLEIPKTAKWIDHSTVRGAKTFLFLVSARE